MIDPTTPPTVADLLTHAEFVRGLARALVKGGAEADDLCQDTWLAALESPPRSARNVRGWLSTVLRNRLRMRRRSDGRRLLREVAVARPDTSGSAEETAGRIEIQRLLVQALEALDEPFRTTVVLRFFDGLRPAEIARRQGVPVTTVHSRLGRAMERLRVRLGGERRDWRSALVPVAGLSGGGSVHVGAGAASAGALAGGILMSMKAKMVLVAVAVVLLIATAGVWLNSRPDPERRPPPPTPEDEIAMVVEPEEETPTGPADGPADPTGVTETADTTAPEEVVDERYLTVIVLDHRGEPAPGARVFFSSTAPDVTEMLRLLREKLRVLHERVRESEEDAERAAITQEVHEVERLIPEYAAPEFELALTADEWGRAVFKAPGAGQVRALRGSAHSYRHLLAPPASGEWSVELRLRAPDDFGPEVPTEERGRSRHTAARGGQRNLKAMGGELRTASATDLGLKWLSDHRSPEGGWDADGFSRRSNCTCDGPGSAGADIAVTGLALLAFLANGQTHKVGVYKRTIGEAQSRLLAWQDGAGRFTLGEPSEFVSHAIALQAMAEAWSLTGASGLKDSAERGVVFLESGISPEDCRPDELVWSACALISAKLGGLDVDDTRLRSIGRRLAGLDPTATSGLFPPASSEALSAAAAFCRGVISAPRPEPSLDLLSLLPRLEGEPDFGLLHFGTYAAFQESGETWQKWNESMKAVVTGGQEKEGHERGSWTPSGPGGQALGRVGTTALATMALQVYYRYPQGLSIR